MHNNVAVLISLLSSLQCPFCELGSPTVDIARRQHHDELVDGTLRCDGCGRTTEVAGSIWHAMGNHKPNRSIAQFSNVLPPVPQLYEDLWRIRSMKLLTHGAFSVEQELAELREHMKSGSGGPSGKLYVDVGTSEGLYARALADEGATVFAVDHSVRFLKRVVSRSTRLSGPGRVVAVRAMAQHLPIRSASLNGAVMGASLNEIGDQQAAVMEMGRVTSAGGALFNMSLIPSATTIGKLAQLAAKLGGVSFPSAEETKTMFTEAAAISLRCEMTGVVLRLAGKK